jgi:hypothetical protein
MLQLIPSFLVEIASTQFNSFILGKWTFSYCPWYAICILHHIWFQSILFLKGVANKVETQLLVNLSLTCGPQEQEDRVAATSEPVAMVACRSALASSHGTRPRLLPHFGLQASKRRRHSVQC